MNRAALARLIFGLTMATVFVWCIVAFVLLGVLPPTTCLAHYDRLDTLVLILTAIFSFLFATGGLLASAARIRETVQMGTPSFILLFGVGLGSILLAFPGCAASAHEKAVVINIVNLVLMGIVVGVSGWAEMALETSAPVAEPTPVPVDTVAVEDFQ